MTKLKISFLITLFCISQTQTIGSPLAPLKDSQLTLIVPYTLGKHQLNIKNLKGLIDINWKEMSITSGDLSLLSTDIQGEDSKLNCHLQESLTLNYEISDFPQSHICVNDQLPTKGKNAPAFPEIKAQLTNSTPLSSSTIILKWLIRGKEKIINHPITLSFDEKKKIVTAKGQLKLKRSDFGIIVKNLLFISADDEMQIDFNIHFGEL